MKATANALKKVKTFGTTFRGPSISAAKNLAITSMILERAQLGTHNREFSFDDMF